MKCLLLTARRYDFKDRDSGRQVRGVNITYLTGDIEQSDHRVGQVPLSIRAPSEVWNDLQSVPGFYDVEFRQRPGPGGKPILQAVGIEFLSTVSFDVERN